MRVIRTEMFFEDVREVGVGVSRARRLNPGIGIAFLRAPERLGRFQCSGRQGCAQIFRPGSPGNGKEL
jgi:hypothetical protein